MRKSLIRWVLLAVIVLGIIIGGPIIINEFYRNNSGYMTIWGAADVLTYYGAIIAASGAAIGVYCSIRYSHKQYREDKRRDVLPYFAINILGRKCVSPFDLLEPLEVIGHAAISPLPAPQQFILPRPDCEHMYVG